MSALSLKALQLNQMVTEKLFYTHYMMKFDLDTRRFTYVTDHKKLIWFYFGWIVLTLFLWPAATFYVIIWQGVFYPETVTSNRLFFTIILSAPMVLCNGLNWALFKNRAQISDYLNRVLDLQNKFGTRIPQKSSSLREMIQIELEKLKNKSTRKEVDLVGLFMSTSVFFFAIIPIMYIPAPFILTIDPFSYPVQAITNYNQLPLWIYLPLRAIPAIGANICCMETARAIRTIFLHIIFASKVTAELLEKIEAIAETDISTAMQHYSILYSVHVKAIRSAAMILFWSIEGGMFIAITTLSGTFVGWKILSPMVYWMNPFMAVLTVIIIAIALPCAAYTADLSISLKNNWLFRINECKRGSRKLNVRLVKAYQPIAYMCACMGYLVGDTKVAMFETIVMNTVDTVMMVNDFIG